MLFSHSLILIPTTHMYLGNIPSNIWHNSTEIFLMPFALFLFWRTYKLLDNSNYSIKEIIIICVLVFINASIKPSFIFCYVVAFPILALLKHRFNKEFFMKIIPVILGIIFIIILKNYVYSSSIYNPMDESSIKIAPFHVWAYFTKNNISLSLISSVFFPICFFLVYYKKIKNNLIIRYSTILFVSSLLIFILLSETGRREFHGNFMWQTIVCNYILFTCCISVFVKLIMDKVKIEKKDIIIFSIFCLHSLSGIIYIIKVLNSDSQWHAFY